MPALARLLADLKSGDEAVAEAAATALAALAALDAQAAGSVRELLHSAESDHRWWAVRALAAFPSARAEWFVDSLRDPAPEVRAAAGLALSAHPDPAAALPLVRALDDPDSVAGLMAVQALVRIGEPAVQPLLEAFDESTPGGKINRMRALAQLKDHRAIRQMMTVLDSDSANLRYWAQDGLERLGLSMVYITPE